MRKTPQIHEENRDNKDVSEKQFSDTQAAHSFPLQKPKKNTDEKELVINNEDVTNISKFSWKTV